MGAFADGLRQHAADQKLAMQQVTAGAISELAARVIERTAVDTGALRANWQASIDIPIEATLDAVDPISDDTLNAVRTVAQGAAGHLFHFVNNLDYASKIEAFGGTLSGAPRGMLAVPVVEWPDIVAKVIASNQILSR